VSATLGFLQADGKAPEMIADMTDHLGSNAFLGWILIAGENLSPSTCMFDHLSMLF
jgi:hypothetical protein